MLSSVLNSDRAIRVNIAIMRAFVKLRAVCSKPIASWRENLLNWRGALASMMKKSPQSSKRSGS